MNMVYLISSLTIELQVFSKTSVNNIFLFLCTQLAAWLKVFLFFRTFPAFKGGQSSRTEMLSHLHKNSAKL